jgi:hypothetical protein
MKRTKHLLTAVIVTVFSLLAIASTEELVEEDISGKNPDIIISADELHSAYENNEVAADAKFNGKIIQVSGVVDDIGKDIMDTIYVSLSAGGEFSFSSVQCFFADAHTSAAASLSKGDYVTIKGKCDGLMMNVLIRGSSLVK